MKKWREMRSQRIEDELQMNILGKLMNSYWVVTILYSYYKYLENLRLEIFLLIYFIFSPFMLRLYHKLNY